MGQNVLGDLIVRLVAETTAFVKGLAQAEKGLQDFGQRAQAAGLALSAAVTAPLVGIAVASAKAAISFESAFAGIRKTLRVTEAEAEATFASIEKGIREMSKRMPVAAEELAKIGEVAGQLGIQKENILSFTDTIAKLGVTTNLSSEEAASSLARIANITGLTQDKFSNLGSAIVFLGNNFATTEQEIVAMSLRIAKAGETAGLSEPQILGLAASLSSVGIEAEAGGSAISRILIDMVKAANQGGEALKNYAETARLPAQAFQEMVKSNPAEALQAVVAGLGKVKQEGGDVFGTLGKLGIEEIRTRDAALGLANAGQLLGKAMNGATDAFAKNTAMNKEAGERFKTTESQLKILWNRVQDAARELGKALLPVLVELMKILTPLVEKLGEAAKWFGELPAPIKMGAVLIGAFAAAIGPALLAVGALASGIGNLISLFNLLKAAQGSQAMVSLAANASAASKAMGILALKVAAVVAAFAVGFKVGTWIREMIDTHLPGLAAALDRAGQAVVNFWDKWVQGRTQANIDLANMSGADFKAMIDKASASGAGVRAAAMAAAQKAGAQGGGGAGAGGGPGAPSGFAGFSDEEKKKAQDMGVALRGELLKTQAQHKGSYAAMMADIQASTMGRLREIDALKKSGPEIDKLRGLVMQLDRAQRAAAKEDWLEKMVGPSAEQTRKKMDELGQAITETGGAMGRSKASYEAIVQQIDAMKVAAKDLTPELRAAAMAASMALAPGKNLGGLLGNVPRTDAFKPNKRPDLTDIDLRAPTILEAQKEAAERVAKAMDKARENTERYAKALDAARNLMDVLGIKADSFLGRLIGGLAAAQKGAADLAAGLKAGFADVTKGGVFKDFDLKKIDFGALIQGIAGVAAAFKQATESASGFQRAAGGAMVGSQVGGAIGSLFGPAGSIIGKIGGGLIGAIGGLFRTPEWVKTAREAGRVLGMNISQAAAEEIQKSAKKLGISIASASLLELPKLMAESSKDARTFTGQIQQLMAGISSGSVPAKEGMKSLTDAFGQVRQAAEEAGTVGDRAMVDIIKRARELGLEIPAISAMIREKLSAAMSSMPGLTGTVDAGKVKGGIQLTDEGSARDQALVFSSVFWASVKEVGLLQAAEAMKPAFDALKLKITEAFGPEVAAAITGGMQAIFDVLGNEAAKGALEGVETLRQALVSLADTGYLTSESFLAIQNQTVAAFKQMQENGVPAGDALRAMAPAIQAAISAAEQFGIPLSADMQHLRELAEQNGIAFKTDPMQRMVDALESIARVLGADLPEATDRFTESIHEAELGAHRLRTAVEQVPAPGPGGGGEAPPDVTAQTGFYSASMPAGKGPGGMTTVGVHPGEEVIVRPRGEAAAPGERGGITLAPVFNITGVTPEEVVAKVMDALRMNTGQIATILGRG